MNLPDNPLSYLPLGVIAFSGIIGWATLSNESAGNARTINDHEIRLRSVEGEISSRLAAIETELRLLRDSLR